MEQNTIWQGIIRNVKYGTTKTGERAVKFQIGEPFYMQVGGKEPVLCATWNNVCAKVTEEIPTNLKDGDKVQVSGKLHAINDDLSLGGTFLFANKIITESKTSKNIKQNIVKLNEAKLKKIVAESVRRVLKEITTVEDAS